MRLEMFCRATVHIPGEGVSELLAVYLHVQSDGNQNLCLWGVFMDHRWVVVIETAKDKRRGALQHLHTPHVNYIVYIQKL